ncbi:MAG: GST-like protein [Myxococcota bacterium]|jgi:GST-like protein
MFEMGGVGPMMGQAGVFANSAPEEMPWALSRYRGESRRLLTVLNDRLADRQFLVGDFSIADIANWSWAHTHAYSGIDVDGLEHLNRWIDEVGARPAVTRGKQIPTPLDLNSPAVQQVTADPSKMLV